MGPADQADALYDRLLASIGDRAADIEPRPLVSHWPHVGSAYRGLVIVGQALRGAFAKTLAYEGWKRSLFPIEWFDSRPERTVASMVDEDAAVACWVRLHIGELPILWNSSGQEYNPDLIVIDADATHWVVEVKMDKEMGSEDVKAKRDAARRWANYVNADASVTVPWRYLLVAEADIDTAKGSWSALKKLGGE